MNSPAPRRPATRPLARRPIRWWPLAVLAGLTGLALAGLWTGEAVDAQQRQMVTYLVLFLFGGLALVWAFFLGRLPRAVRWGTLGAAVSAALAFVVFFEITGVTGDFLPVVSPRFASVPDLERDRAGRGSVALAAADDFPQYLGPHRDGTVPAPDGDWVRDWSDEPPRELWRVPVGAGWSGFAVVGDAAITQEERGGEHVVVRRDAATGAEVWARAEEGVYQSTIAGDGPRSTPAIVDGRVFTLGPSGTVQALDLADGQRLWRRDLMADTDAELPDWGWAGSPLFVPAAVAGEDLVVVGGDEDGPGLVAYRASDGLPAWTGAPGGARYSAPRLATLGGREQILLLGTDRLAGHDPATGTELWSVPWASERPNVAMPIVLAGDAVGSPSREAASSAAGGELLLASSGYGVGAGLFRVVASGEPAAGSDWSVEEIWRSPRLKAKFTNPVALDAADGSPFVYGLDDGVLVCLDLSTGERCWKRGRYGHGQTVRIGDEHLLVTAESGEILLLAPTPDGPGVIGSFQALDGKSWNPPAVAGGRLFVRNADEAVAYALVD